MDEQDREDDLQSYSRQKLDIYSPMRDRENSAIIMLTNPENDLYEFELFLRSLRKTPQGLVKIGGEDWKPLMNEQGINSVMAAIESVVNRMSPLSNFDELGVKLLYNTLKENLIQILIFNRETYLVDRKNRDLIIGNSLRFAYSFMRRAYEEGDRKFWKGSVVETKHTQEALNPKRSVINPFSWGKHN